MPTISLCMIVKNEEDILERCLESTLDIVDEIIIVDTGSTDGTRKIAQKYTDKIYDFQWIDDFSAARNYSFSKATMDYILWLDADDVIIPKDREKLKKLKATLDSSVDIVMMKYNIGFDIFGNVTFSYFRERLSKRSRNFQWHEPVHEYLELYGKIIYTDVCITHKKMHISDTGRNIAIYKKILKDGKDLSPRGLYYYARELKDNNQYPEAIEYFNKFLDTEKGWVEDNIRACYELSKCYEVTGEKTDSLRILFRSFEHDTPRGEICCQIGYYFKSLHDYEKARFWFELVLSLKKPDNCLGFIEDDYWDFIPCIELVVCYDKLNDIEKAIQYNEKAGDLKPNHPSVLYNKNYFEGIKK